MLLEGKKLLITGVLTPASIAFDSARVAQEQGADIVLTGFGRGMGLTEKTARRLPSPPDVLELDVNQPEHIDAVAKELEARWGRVDGVLHAIAFAPEDALGGNFLNTPWESVATALQTSAFSLKALAVGPAPADEGIGRLDRQPRLRRHAGLAALRLDGREQGGARVGDALPGARPRAARHPRELRLGRAARRPSPRRASPGSTRSPTCGHERAPLGWDTSNPEPVARAVAFLLSEWSVGITGRDRPRGRRLPRDGRRRPARGRGSRLEGGARAYSRTSDTSSSMSILSLTRTPPVSIAWFHFRSQSPRLIVVDPENDSRCLPHRSFGVQSLNSTSSVDRARDAPDRQVARSTFPAVSDVRSMLVPRNVITGWVSTSKKSGERRCPSRVSSLVEMLAVLKVTSMVESSIGSLRFDGALELVEAALHVHDHHVLRLELGEGVRGIDGPRARHLVELRRRLCLRHAAPLRLSGAGPSGRRPRGGDCVRNDPTRPAPRYSFPTAGHGRSAPPVGGAVPLSGALLVRAGRSHVRSRPWRPHG